MLLGAHSLTRPEPSKRLYDVLRAVPHPDSRPETIDHDLLLLQVGQVQPSPALLHAPAVPHLDATYHPVPAVGRSAPCFAARPRRPQPDAPPHPQLSEKAALGPAVQPLPWQRVNRDVPGGTLCDVAGWGVTNHRGSRPDRLQHLSLPVIDRATCNLRRFHDGTVSERMMCAESDRRRDSCKVREGRLRGCGRGLGGGAWEPEGPRARGRSRPEGGAWNHGAEAVWVAPGAGPGQWAGRRRGLGVSRAWPRGRGRGLGACGGEGRGADPRSRPAPRRGTPGVRWCAAAWPRVW